MAILKYRRRREFGALQRLLLGLCLLITSLLLGRAGAGPAPTEYEVKAVFLFNFAHFVEWPPNTFDDPRTPFVIGILGQDPFGSALDETVRGETIHGRPIVIERYRTLAEMRACQILFIDRTATDQPRETLDALAKNGTLTVSDVETPAPRDVVIRFLNENQRIRLRINIDSARSAGLTISSKLLRPAQVVGTTNPAQS